MSINATQRNFTFNQNKKSVQAIKPKLTQVNKKFNHPIPISYLSKITNGNSKAINIPKVDNKVNPSISKKTSYVNLASKTLINKNYVSENFNTLNRENKFQVNKSVNIPKLLNERRERSRSIHTKRNESKSKREYLKTTPVTVNDSVITENISYKEYSKKDQEVVIPICKVEAYDSLDNMIGDNDVNILSIEFDNNDDDCLVNYHTETHIDNSHYDNIKSIETIMLKHGIINPDDTIGYGTGLTRKENSVALRQGTFPLSGGEGSTWAPLNFIQDNINNISVDLLFDDFPQDIPAAKFTSVEYRRLLSTFLKIEYGSSILDDHFTMERELPHFLTSHEVNDGMRMKMTDWMLEVLCNFRCDDNTYFLAVSLMDKFFFMSSDTIKPDDLHLLGICCMFIASKFIDVCPIKLKMILNKISQGKFTQKQIVETEEKIIKTLNYEICTPTLLDFINYYSEELFYFYENNFCINDDILYDYLELFLTTLNIKIDKLSKEKLHLSRKLSLSLLSFIKEIFIFLGKLCCHNYEISCIRPSLIAASIILVGIKICEQINKDSYLKPSFMEELCTVSRCKKEEIVYYGKVILSDAQEIETKLNGLNNLKRFHFDSIVNMQTK